MVIRPDKITHALAGYGIALTVMAASHNIATALLAVVVIGAGKEWIYDARTGGDVEVMDFYATLCGGVAGLVVLSTLNYLVAHHI